MAWNITKHSGEKQNTTKNWENEQWLRDTNIGYVHWWAQLIQFNFSPSISYILFPILKSLLIWQHKLVHNVKRLLERLPSFFEGLSDTRLINRVDSAADVPHWEPLVRLIDGNGHQSCIPTNCVGSIPILLEHVHRLLLQLHDSRLNNSTTVHSRMKGLTIIVAF